MKISLCSVLVVCIFLWQVGPQNVRAQAPEDVPVPIGSGETLLTQIHVVSAAGGKDVGFSSTNPVEVQTMVLDDNFHIRVFLTSRKEALA